MRGRLTISLALLGAILAWGPPGHAARTVTDSAGRRNASSPSFDQSWIVKLFIGWGWLSIAIMLASVAEPYLRGA